MNILKAACAASLASLIAASAWAQTDFVVGSSSPGGSYYLYAGGLTGYINENTDQIDATARTTGGSVENSRLLNRERLDAAFVNAMVVYQNRHGEGQFEDQGPSEAVRGIAMVDIAPSHWVTLADSGIESFEDLKGKSVSIGAAGSGTANTNATVLKAMGLFDQIDIKYLGFAESAQNLRDGAIDAFAGGSALPMPAVVDIATRSEIRLLAIEPQVIEKIQEISPATTEVTIPAGTYPGVDHDVLTVANPSTLVTREGVPEEVIYEVAKMLTTAESQKHMESVYKAWDPAANPDLWERIEVPLHPGARKAFEEAGWM